MVQDKQRRVNSNTDITFSEIALNSSTKTKILDANVDRIMAIIRNSNCETVYICLQPATDVATNKIYEFLGGTVTHYELPTDNIYTGEISAISETGTPTIQVGEY